MPGPAPTILVADDEEMVLKFIEIVLRREGFRVLAASGGAEALQLCGKGAEQVDLAVLDIMMPEMDGPRLCRELRETYPNLRVLFISGYNEAELTRRFGPESLDLLKKPFTSADLVKRVKQILGRPVSVSA